MMTFTWNPSALTNDAPLIACGFQIHFLYDNSWLLEFTEVVLHSSGIISCVVRYSQLSAATEPERRHKQSNVMLHGEPAGWVQSSYHPKLNSLLFCIPNTLRLFGLVGLRPKQWSVNITLSATAFLIPLHWWIFYVKVTRGPICTWKTIIKYRIGQT